MLRSCHLRFDRKVPFSRSRHGRGASELLHHVIAREAGRLAVDRRRDIIALFLVEAWRLNTERRQRDPGAAASSAFLFCHRQYAAANPRAASIFWQKEPGDIDEPEFGASVEPADDLASLWIADEYRAGESRSILSGSNNRRANHR